MRSKSPSGYRNGDRVVDLADEYDVHRATVANCLDWQVSTPQGTRLYWLDWRRGCTVSG